MTRTQQSFFFPDATAADVTGTWFASPGWLRLKIGADQTAGLWINPLLLEIATLSAGELQTYQHTNGASFREHFEEIAFACVAMSSTFPSADADDAEITARIVALGMASILETDGGGDADGK